MKLAEILRRGRGSIGTAGTALLNPTSSENTKRALSLRAIIIPHQIKSQSTSDYQIPNFKKIKKEYRYGEL